MATFLSRLGRFAFRRRLAVVLAWFAVFGAVGLASATAGELPEDTSSMPGSESQAAFELLEERFPAAAGSADAATADVVFVAPAGEGVAEHRAAVDGLVEEVSGSGQVAAVQNPFQTRAVSADGGTAYATVRYSASADDLTDATRDQLADAVERARATGLTVEVGGPVLATEPSPGGVSEIVGVGVAALVLLVMFGSLVAAGLPLLTALLGVGISLLAVQAVGGVFGLSATSGTLATMLGLAVGIDYALFVLSRYREERLAGRPPEEAVGLAVGTAGSAVVFAGLTVVIALSGLAIIGLPAATKMGVTAAGAVLVAMAIALTLVPALLGFCQNAVLPRGRRREDNAGARWARFVLRRPVAVLVASVAGLVVLAAPTLDLRLGMPGDEAKSTETTERRAYDALAAGFGPGVNGPLTIVVDARGADDPKAAASAVAATVADTPGVVSVSPPAFNDTGDTALLSAIPTTAPTDERTKDLVQRLRDARSAATFLVTGAAAVNIDVARTTQDALVPYLAVVLGLAFLLLVMIFRSLLVPLKAVLGFLLSLLAALGVVVAVFQWGWGADLIGLQQTGPIISMMPIVLVGMIFGLAMDYEVFLVSRMREAHVAGEPARQAVVSGFRHSARVVTAAALIMIAVFAGFVGGDLAMIKMIGLSLAAAVLFDAFVVRMAIVPAVLALLGERAWSLPRWLDRPLPHVDVEGAALQARSRQAGGD